MVHPLWCATKVNFCGGSHGAFFRRSYRASASLPLRNCALSKAGLSPHNQVQHLTPTRPLCYRVVSGVHGVMFLRSKIMNLDKILNFVAWCCIPLAGIGFYIGGESDTYEGAKILFKVFGLSLFVYSAKCIKSGKEDFLTVTWSSGVVTKEDEPFLFWFAMVLLLSMSLVFIFL